MPVTCDDCQADCGLHGIHTYCDACDEDFYNRLENYEEEVCDLKAENSELSKRIEELEKALSEKE